MGEEGHGRIVVPCEAAGTCARAALPRARQRGEGVWLSLPVVLSERRPCPQKAVYAAGRIGQKARQVVGHEYAPHGVVEPNRDRRYG